MRHSREIMEEVEKPASKRIVRQKQHWIYDPFFKYACGILIFLTILLVFSYATSFLSPVIDFISILFVPIALSLMLYYILRPVVNLLERKTKAPRWVIIISIYLIFAILFVFFVAYIGPILINQFTGLTDSSVEMISKMKISAKAIMERVFNLNLDKEIEQRFFYLVEQASGLVSQNALQLISFITRTAVVLAVIPFIVFYLLKDDEEFANDFLTLFPGDFGNEGRKILHNMDQTLSNYIQGLVIVSTCIGVLLFIGYSIIGLNYALVLSLFALIFMTIPFLGPFLSILPALFVGLSDSPFMVVKVFIVFAVVQQIESNVISPLVIGQRLNIHPLTIILLLLAAGSLYGLIGLLLATPLYALVKVLIESLYKIYRLRYNPWKKKQHS